jgi:hypothetical protein
MATRCIGDGGNARHRRGDQQGAQGGRLQGRRQLRGNDEAAQKFKAETGIPVYKWDVASFDACAAGVKQVEADSARSTSSSTMPASPAMPCFTSMKPEQWTR